MPTRALRDLIGRLESVDHPNWGERALLACLMRLRDGGPTEWRSVEVERADAFGDGFTIVYRSPWGPIVGLRVTRDSVSADGPPWYLGVYTTGAEPNAEEFGREIADFAIAEPLGTVADRLVRDSAGLGWWGQPPLPL